MIEKIFFNGNILTQDKKNPVVTAFAVATGKIIATGSDAEILQLQNSNTKLETLSNKTVLPGFNDAHIHIWKVGNLMTYLLDLRGVQSMEEMQQKLSEYANKNPDLKWIQARGFNEALFPDRRMPNRFDLDKVIDDRPVCVMRTCAHQIIVNTKALELTAITKDTPSPSGGEIKILASGEIAGHFTETALGLVMDKIPAYSDDQYRNMILAAQDELIIAGITFAADPAVMPDLLEVYKSMDRNGELKIRVNAFPIRVPDGASRPLTLPSLYSSDHLKIDTVKFFSDGGLSGKTAALKHPYKNSTETGVLRLKKDFFTKLALEAQEAGFRIATHAIGDAAIDLVIEVYEDIFSGNGNHIRHRIEHLGLPSEKNLEKMKAMSISAVTQSIFLYELGKNFRQYLVDDYLERCYPVKSVLEKGINVALSSDAPVVKNFRPVMGIQSAVERKDVDGYVFAERERISVEEAVYAYTMGSAIANGDEDNRGSIEKGKWADFICLNENITSVSPSKIGALETEAVYIGGERVN